MLIDPPVMLSHTHMSYNQEINHHVYHDYHLKTHDHNLCDHNL